MAVRPAGTGPHSAVGDDFVDLRTCGADLVQAGIAWAFLPGNPYCWGLLRRVYGDLPGFHRGPVRAEEQFCELRHHVYRLCWSRCSGAIIYGSDIFQNRQLSGRFHDGSCFGCPGADPILLHWTIYRRQTRIPPG